MPRTPRIASDPDALAYTDRRTVARGSTPSPVLTLHTIGDDGAVCDQVLLAQVSGYPALILRQYSERGRHRPGGTRRRRPDHCFRPQDGARY